MTRLPKILLALPQPTFPPTHSLSSSSSPQIPIHLLLVLSGRPSASCSYHNRLLFLCLFLGCFLRSRLRSARLFLLNLDRFGCLSRHFVMMGQSHSQRVGCIIKRTLFLKLDILFTYS